MKIIFIGDVHGQFSEFANIVNNSDADIAIQCGDFGLWTDCVPGQPLPTRYHIDLNKPVFFVEGNHDNHAWLASLKTDKGVELFHNLTWMPRMSKCEFNGKRFLFCGGADSIDKAYRLAYYPDTWWPGEVISKEILTQVEPGEYFDYVVAHDRPEFVTRRINPDLRIIGDSSMVLSNLYGKITTPNWVCGHWHEYSQAGIFSTTFTTLNMLSFGGGMKGYGSPVMEVEV